MTDANWIHDEDSFYPNEINDDERDLTDDEALMQDIISGAIFDLEEAAETRNAVVAVNRKTVTTALQLLKAYFAAYDLSVDEYETEYD